MPTRLDVGSNWSQIVADWYLGVVPSTSADDGWAALGAIERLCPERLAQVLVLDARGYAIMAPLVDLGLVLLACEGRACFAPVLARIKADERSAEDEVRIVATLARLGYAPSFEPDLPGGKRVDAEVLADGVKVYVEVAAPDQFAR
jgi:hypothetical protein